MNTENLQESKSPEDVLPKTNRRERRRHLMGVNSKAVPAILDELEFGQNKCSPNARRIGSHAQNTNVDFWIDKHYHIREQQGDDFGNKRDGIEPEKVHTLVKKCIPHLILYSSFLRNFTFLNYDKLLIKERIIRVVCQGIYDGNQLNVVIEGHVISLTDIEITIVTAIQKNEYLPHDGQYAVLLDDNKGSELFYCSKRKLGTAAVI